MLIDELDVKAKGACFDRGPFGLPLSAGPPTLARPWYREQLLIDEHYG